MTVVNAVIGRAFRRAIRMMACAGTAVAINASAENHALLVGVSNYPNLDKRMQLEGPANDVALIRDVLLQKNFARERMEVLADGVEGAGDPTRGNILAAMDRLIGRTKSGDFVYLHFAGHGSQQPSSSSKAPPEPDGRDEIFLPRDIGAWNDKVGAVQNALVDSEMNVVVKKLRDRGAFVWVIFDSCHSGTMTRSVSNDEVRYRQVAPDALKIPEKAFITAAQNAVKSRGADAGKSGAIGGVAESGQGGFVAFYAAQTIETTPEMPLPAGEEGRKPHGLFSYVMAETIRRYGGITYRQLGQQILQRYAALGMNSTTPLFEGSGSGKESALNAKVFGVDAGDEVRQWPLKVAAGQYSIGAGRLNQFGDGALFALVPLAASADKDIIGYLRAESIAPLMTTLLPVANGDTPAPKAESIRTGQYLRLVDPNLRMTLKVALPPPHGKSIERDHVAVTKQQGVCTLLDLNRQETGVEKDARKVIQSMRSSSSGDTRIEWVDAGQEADLRLLIADNRVWLLPPNGLLAECGPSKTLSVAAAVDAGALRSALDTGFKTIAKASNLLRLAGALSGGQSFGRPGLKIEAKLIRAGGKESDLEFVPQPEFKDGDHVKFIFSNGGEKAKDVTVLFLDSHYGIAAMFPNDDQPVNRIESLGKVETAFEIDTTTTGIERMVVIAVDAEKHSDRADFSFLAQPALRDATTRGASFDLRNVFDEAGFGVRTRGLSGVKSPIGAADMRVLSWSVGSK